jgi:cardiolipin synthase
VRFPWVLSNWNYRDHCKIVVIDGKEAFTGGINIGYEYTGLKPTVGFWRDTHLRIIGEAAVDLHTMFNVHWNIASPERKSIEGRSHPLHNFTSQGMAVSGQAAEWAAELSTLDGNVTDTATKIESLQNVYMQTFEGNPGIPTQVIREVYFICLTQATKTLDITNPYFVPDADIIMAIKTAVARGVRVRLLVPHHSNQKFVDLASRTYFGELLEAGVHIYQYNKGMLHAKVMIIDQEIAEVGAANYDMRSFRLNYEVCEVIYSTEVAGELTEQFERDLIDSVPLRIEDLLHRSLPQRIMEQGARILSPMI